MVRMQAEADAKPAGVPPARDPCSGLPGSPTPAVVLVDLLRVGLLRIGPIRGVRLRSGRALGGRLPVCLLLSGLLLGSACAYSFTGSNLPAHVKTVAIPNFANETLEPGLDQEITTVVIDRFIKDGRLKLAPDGKASCRLAGRVVRYENHVNNYRPDESPGDYIVVVTVAMTLRDMVKDRDLWKDDALTRTAIYVPGATSGVGSEREARSEALRTLAGDMITRTMEPW